MNDSCVYGVDFAIFCLLQLERYRGHSIFIQHLLLFPCKSQKLGNHVDQSERIIPRGLHSNLSFGEVNRRFYGRKFRFTLNVICDRKTADLPL